MQLHKGAAATPMCRGTSAPNAALRDISAAAETPEIKQYTQNQIQRAISSGELKSNKDGTITLYRGGKPSSQNDLVSATYDKNVAQEFAGKAGQLHEIQVNPEDIRAFIGKAEKEVLIDKFSLESLSGSQKDNVKIPADSGSTIASNMKTGLSDVAKGKNSSNLSVGDESGVEILKSGKRVGAVASSKSGDAIYLSGIEVDRQFQKSGIGTKTIARLFSDNPEVKYITGEAQGSEGFFKKLGAEVGEYDEAIDGATFKLSREAFEKSSSRVAQQPIPQAGLSDTPQVGKAFRGNLGLSDKELATYIVA
jgi:hypothetical protein